MPRKIEIDKTYGEKLIILFARLLFTGEKYSLIELSKQLNCSKQTIQRLIDDITRAYHAPLEEFIEKKRKYYQIKKQSGYKQIQPLSESEFAILLMCQSFTEHLLGKRLFEEANNAILKSQASAPIDSVISSRYFGDFLPGTIDYTAFYEIILNLIKAMQHSNICEIKYRGLGAQLVETLLIKPLKLFSYRDTIYLHGRLARKQGTKYREPEFDPLLAIHRMKSIQLTERKFDFPSDYDFEKFFNQNFGIIKKESFQVEAEFTGWAASFVEERIWSPDQQISKKADGKVRLTFSVSSEPELIGWLLQFGPNAIVIKPARIKEKIIEMLNKTIGLCT
jgi:predicted DNA-binding transcriptional regulator YafY